MERKIIKTVKRRDPYLEHSEKGRPDGVKVAPRFLTVQEVEPATKELHAQQRKDHNEQKQQQQQTSDGAHTVEEGGHQVSQGGPIPEQSKDKLIGVKKQQHDAIGRQ